MGCALRRMFGALGLGWVLLTAGPSYGSDYSTDERAWNGVGYLQQTSREAKVELRVVETLDWSAIKARDNLLIFYPTSAMPTRNLLRFVSDGGILLSRMTTGNQAHFYKPSGLRGSARTCRSTACFSMAERPSQPSSRKVATSSFTTWTQSHRTTLWPTAATAPPSYPSGAVNISLWRQSSDLGAPFSSQTLAPCSTTC